MSIHKQIKKVALCMMGCLFLASCGSNNKQTSISEEELQAMLYEMYEETMAEVREANAKEPEDLEEVKEVKESEESISKETIAIILGETIQTEYNDYTFKNVVLSYEVIPSEHGTFFTKYTPDQGNVYIDITVDVKNNEKSSVKCDTILNIIADYNDGYTYKGFATVETGSSGFSYAMSESINPLETKTLRYLIQCPKEIDETDNPLFFSMTLDGNDYVYHIK